MSNFLLATQAPDTAANFDAGLRAATVGVDQIEPDAFEGFGSAVGNSLGRGLSRVGEAVALTSAAPLVIKDAIDGTNSADAIFSAFVDPAREAVDYYAPDAKTTGTASRIAGGLIEGLSPLLLGPVAGPVALVGTQGLSGASDIVNEGGSSVGAVAAGITRATAAAVGFRLPASIGGTIGKRLASGAGINVAAGASARLTEAGLLAATGDDALSDAQLAELAKPETYVLDALLGAAFGAIGGGSEPRIGPAQLEALLVARNAEHFKTRSAPGEAATPEATSLHQAALQETLRLLDNDQPVAITADVGRAEFVERPPSPAQAEIVEAADRQSATMRRSGELVEPLPDPERPALAVEYVPAPSGKPEFGMLGSDIAVASSNRFPAGPIRLAGGNSEYGAGHISPKREAEFREVGYASGLEALEDVTANYTDVYEQANGRLLLVKKNGRKKYTAVELRPSEGGYSVTTWFLESKPSHGKKPYEEKGGRKLLVRVARDTKSDPSSPVSTADSYGRDGGSLTLGPSNEPIVPTQEALPRSSIAAFAEEGLRRQLAYISQERASMQAVLDGTAQPTGFSKNFDLTPEEARDRLEQLARMEAEAPAQFSAENPVIRASFEIHARGSQAQPAITLDTIMVDRPAVDASGTQSVVRERADVALKDVESQISTLKEFLACLAS